jgi:para-aminobenzoate synthetase component 1
MNNFGEKGIPFLFIIDSSLKMPEIHELSKLPEGIKFSTPLKSNVLSGQIYSKPYLWKINPVPYNHYLNAFSKVKEEIKQGNSYLVNLTFPTKIETELSLSEIFRFSCARYKLLYHNGFVVFSPETFVRIEEGVIRSYPMKGTIDESIPDAEEVILNDEKEMAEHNTIVDLIRNDLSIISDNVSVTRYRYFDRIKTKDKTLLQVSSEITGYLEEGYRSRLGDIIAAMLPAGSVTGAPKKETVRIIRECENYERGWYTGIFGVFDGVSLDSAVMIRYIENNSGEYTYKSGGGITYLSDPVREYQELIDKVYVPIA